MTSKVTVRIPLTMWGSITEFCEKNGLSVSEMVRRAVLAKMSREVSE